MFRTIRRKDRDLGAEAAEKILREGEDGVLACAGDDGYPYAVPVNYIYRDGKIYLHGAKEGHKLDAVRREPKVSFCVIARREILPAEYSTAYRSAIVFGRARVIESAEELVPLLDALAARFTEDSAAERMARVRRGLPATAVIEITPEHMSAKGRD